MKVIHLDTNHPLLINQLNKLGFTNDEDYLSSKEDIEAKIHNYDGFIIRSRFKIDKAFIDKSTNLKFIGEKFRVVIALGLTSSHTDALLHARI